MELPVSQLYVVLAIASVGKKLCCNTATLNLCMFNCGWIDLLHSLTVWFKSANRMIDL